MATEDPYRLMATLGTSADGAIEVISPEEAAGIGAGTEILVVDDHATNLEAYEAALAPLGRSVVRAGSGLDALARLLEQDFALVLLDVSMPGMTGLETAELIRRRPRNRRTPILFITGMSPSTELMLKAYGVGGFDFIVKPIVPELLRAKIAVYLQLQERTQLAIRQMTQLREAHEQLRELAPGRLDAHVQRRDELLAMLGHELRNPLAAMAAAIEVVKIREGGLGRELSILERHLGHLTHIVDDLVDASRLTAGKVELRREAIDLAVAVAEALDLVRPLIEKRQHHVVADVPASVLVDADRDRLHQVIANLVGNAAIYTAAGGRIEIRARVDGAFVLLVVRDNGHGMPATLLPSVFDVFVQGERTLERREGGLGIGLTLVRSLVELHGGTVEAHSDGPGKGAQLTVRWPVASSPAPMPRR
jgi:signal transduction histidine kinase